MKAKGKPAEKLLAPLTPQQLKFATETAMIGQFSDSASTKIEATMRAYPNMDPKTASSHGAKLMHNPRIRNIIEELQQDIRAKFIMMSEEAQVRVEDLAKNAKQEKVKLQANIEILDRGGFKPPDKVELHHLGVFGDVSLDDIRDIVRNNLEGGGN